MPAVRSFQEKLYASAVDALYQCATDDDGWDPAMQQLSRLFDAPRLSFLRILGGSDPVVETRAFHHDAAAQRLYVEHYFQLDPTAEAAVAAPVGEWLNFDRILDPHRTAHREYVHDFAIPNGIRWVTGAKVHADAQGSTYVSFQRPLDHRAFGSEASTLFHRFMPHFRRVAALSAELRRARRQEHWARGALDGIAVAAMVVSAGGHVLLANREGEQLLRREAPLSAAGGCLHLADADAQARFARALQQACADAGSGADIIRVREAACLDEWLVRIVPWRGDRAPGAGPCALVYASPARPPPAPAALLRQAFGFTPVESEIAFLMCEGLSVKEVARARNVSEHTVRSQVREILAKAGVRRQAQLANLVFGMVRLWGERSPPG